MGGSVIGGWFLDRLEKIANEVDGKEGRTVVKKVDIALEKYQDKGLITEEEKDALRHYYGMRDLSNRYGGTVAWTMGYMNEGLDWIMPQIVGGKSDVKIQADIDLYNNDIALKHVKEGMGYDLKKGMSIEKVRGPLEFLKVPPVPEEYDRSR